jgi:hypothetical protein
MMINRINNTTIKAKPPPKPKPQPPPYPYPPKPGPPYPYPYITFTPCLFLKSLYIHTICKLARIGLCNCLNFFHFPIPEFPSFIILGKLTRLQPFKSYGEAPTLFLKKNTYPISDRCYILFEIFFIGLVAFLF